MAERVPLDMQPSVSQRVSTNILVSSTLLAPPGRPVIGQAFFVLAALADARRYGYSIVGDVGAGLSHARRARALYVQEATARSAVVRRRTHDGIVYCAGQVGIEPSTGVVPDGVGPQTRQALSNLAAVLSAAGSDLEHVVKATVYVRDASMFSEMDAAYADVFGAARPARTTIRGIDFRPGVDVGIDLIAALS